MIGRVDLPDLDGALCAQVDADIFFPEKGGSTRDAKGICATCDVRDACLEFALSRRERFGIWGATSERERQRIARERGIRWDDDLDNETPWEDEYPEIAS